MTKISLRKKILKRMKNTFIFSYGVNFIYLTAKLKLSKFFLFRKVGEVFSLMFIFLLKDNYYKVLVYVKSHLNHPIIYQSRLAKIKLKLFVSKALVSPASATAEEFVNIFNKVNFPSEAKYHWADKFMKMGRMDLARIIYLQLVEKEKHHLPREYHLDAFRQLGAICFMLGLNDESLHYWKLAGHLKRSFFKATTPTEYRILGTAWLATIGHNAMLDYYVKYKKLHRSVNQRTVALVDPTKIANMDLLQKFSQLGITILRQDQLETDYNFWSQTHNAPLWTELTKLEQLALVDDFWEFDFSDGEVLGYAHADARIQKEWEAAGLQPLFSVEPIERKWIATYIRDLGLPADAWFVCLHVREAGFHKKWNSLYPTIRDANIDDYIPAIEKIVNAGGWVIRMGDNSMKALPKMKNVIDYAHNLNTNKLADIILPVMCRFLIGTNSGYATIPANYGVPVLLTNWTPIGWPLWPSLNLMMPKLFRSKSTKMFLTLEQIFQTGLAYIQNSLDIPEEVEVIDNSSLEIESAVEEMLNTNDMKNLYRNNSEYQSMAEHYEKIAKLYGGFTGSRLAFSFIKNYPQVFGNSIDDSKTNKAKIYLEKKSPLMAVEV